jgi:DNA-binding PadR family transcriptional regulator
VIFVRYEENIEIYLDFRYIAIYVNRMKHGHRGHNGHLHEHSHRHGRPFDYGELRLVVLALIEKQPRHGYDLMRAIEERMGGSYSPSPGVIYPTLSWLEDSGYADVEAESAGRKRYRITAEGEAFLTANRAAIDSLFARIGTPGGSGGRYKGVPAPVLRGMENLKLALRLRLKQSAFDDTTVNNIAAALDAAARAVENS